MNRIAWRRRLLSALFACIFLGGPAAAQDYAMRHAQGPVTMAGQIPDPHVVQRWPAVRSDAVVSAKAAARINRTLRMDGANALKAAEACQEMGGGPEAWTRDVDLTMAGPHYLSMVAYDSYYCGGPYPNDGLVSAFVFDLATGRPVDWIKLFPEGAEAVADIAANGTAVGLVAWPGLTRRADAQGIPGCNGAVNFHRAFAVWLDARAGVLRAVTTNLPHVAQACATPIALTVPELRREGFAPTLIDALQSAHELQTETDR